MKELFKFFIILGTTGFGGPLSLVQLMREEYVDKKKLLSQQEFDQVFTLIKAMPGPIAFQMAAYLGKRFHGFWGALLAGFSLIFPSFVMICGIAYFYQQLSHLTQFKYLLDGFLYSVTAIILFSMKSMFLSLYRKKIFWFLLVLASWVTFNSYLPEPVIILASGFFSYAYLNIKDQSKLFSSFVFIIDWEKIYQIFKTCLYGGTFVFGTGLALLPVLKTEFVDVLHWLPLQEFNDGVIFGQMTPGPVTITASFLGYRISGFWGAFAATLGVFLMPFIHMTTWFPSAVKWLTRQKWIEAFIVGASSAVVGAILMTLVKMNKTSVGEYKFWIIFCCTFYILLKKPKVSLLSLIFLSGITNLLITFAAMKSI